MSETPTASEAPETLLEVRNLAVAFEGGEADRGAVRDVSFDVRRGEYLSLVGRSGSGKSVSLASVLGLVGDPPGIVAGSIRWRGRDILPDPGRYLDAAGRRSHPRWTRFRHDHDRLLADVRGREIGLVLQDPFASLDPQATIEEQMRLTLRHNAPDLLHGDVSSRLEGWLDRVGLSDPGRVLRRYPGELSGGMCQRAMLAIVLCTSPTLLLADEPTSALDATVQLEVLELLAGLNREEGLAIVLVTHEIGVALRYADRLHVVSEGRTVESGTPDDLRASAERGEVHPATRALLEAAAALNPARETGSGVPRG